MILTALLLASVADGAADVERAGWKYRREVTVVSEGPIASLVLPPELSAHSHPRGFDLRLVDARGGEIPYVLDWSGEREGLATWRAGVKDIRRESETTERHSPVRSQWLVDFGTRRSFTELKLDVRGDGFAWHVRVETSEDGAGFETIATDAPLFDQEWNGARVRRTSLEFDQPRTGRFVRLTARGAPDAPAFELTGLEATLRRRLKGDAWSMDVAAARMNPTRDAQVSRYELAASSALPFDEVEIDCDDAAFARRVRLLEVTERGGGSVETVLGDGSLFRLRSADAVIAGAVTRLATRNGTGGTLVLEIADGDSPALRDVRVRLRGTRLRLVFPTPAGGVTLYHGNPVTRAPLYDIEAMRSRLVQAAGLMPARLGPEVPNPGYRREPPLRFPATLGAPVDASGWRAVRPLLSIDEEDVYALTLTAADLRVLRGDLADLRIVNAEDRQVPFLLDRDAAEEAVTLAVARTSGDKRSSFELKPNGSTALGTAKPMVSRVELEIANPFFERSARFGGERRRGRRDTRADMLLARRPPSTEDLVIATAMPLEPATLEVDDGDDEPLDIRKARAFVRIPRVVFKAAPGKLRLLLGNGSIDAPRYDLAGLRSELLSYSAATAAAGALAENTGARSSIVASLGNARSETIVWGAIITAIVALLGLTIRTLNKA
jgi:hypothetical protein